MTKKEFSFSRTKLSSRANWIFAIILMSAFLIQLVFSDFYFSSWFNVGLSLAIICFSLIQLRKRLGLLLFTLSLDFFLIARPVIDITTEFSQYYPMHYSLESAVRANAMIGLSMVALVFGQLIYEGWLGSREGRLTRAFPDEERRKYIELLGIGVGIISFIALFITIQEKIDFRQHYSYTSLYAHFESQLPFVIQGFAAIAVTMVIIIIVSSRRNVVVYGAILLYLALEAWYMRTGVRADFTKVFLFAMFIFLQRDLLPRFRKKYLMTALVGSVTLGVILGSIFYTVELQRLEYQKTHQHSVPVQLLYDQSISYMTLNRGQELKELPLYENKHYTFGPFTDQFGKAGDEQPYTMGLVEHGDSLAADIAYHLYGDNAFAGYGLGSSYIMELFHDFSYPGIALYSILMGMLLASLSSISWKHFLIDAIKLRLILEVFYIPRAPAMQFIVNLMVPQFYLPVGGSLVFAWGVYWLRHRRKLV